MKYFTLLGILLIALKLTDFISLSWFIIILIPTIPSLLVLMFIIFLGYLKARASKK